MSVGGSGSSWTGDKAWRESYYSNVWVYRCAQVIAEDLATLPLRVGPDPTEPGNYDMTHPLAVLLGPPPGTPNPETSSRSLWLWTVVQRLITGAFAWELEIGPDSGLPMFLWPIPASHVQPVASKGGSRYFDAYEVGSGRDKLVMNRNRMVYDHRPSALDWRKPESVLDAAKLDISVAVMQDRYDHAFLKNDARPAAVVVHEAYDNIEERDAWRRSFVATHGGPDNAGKIEFVETTQGGAKPSEAMLVQTLGLSQKDAEFIKRYESKLRAIEVAFGVPRSRLMDASGRTFANADAEWKGYWRTTMKNLALELSDAINTKLAPKFGMDVCWFDFSGNEYLRDEPPFQAEDGIVLYRGGVVSLNELRTKVLYLPPVDGGDDLVVQEVVAPSSTELPGSPNSQDVPDQEVGEVDEPELPDEGDMSSVAASPAQIARTLRKVEHNRRVREQRAAATEAEARRLRMLWRQTNDNAERLENRWDKRWARFFTQQQDSIIARLEGKRGRQALREGEPPNVDAVFDRVFWFNQTDELAVEMYEDVVAANATQLAATFGISFDVQAPYVQDFIRVRANQLAGHVTDTTYTAIKGALSEGVGQGESIPDIAKRIRTLFQQTYKNRSTVVARTEVISAYNGSTAEVVNNVPDDVAAGMEWLATSDDRTRDAHAFANGQRIAAGGAFIVGGESLRYPGDPAGSADNVVQCRCTVFPITLDKLKD